jgi:hypothetical protein
MRPSELAHQDGGVRHGRRAVTEGQWWLGKAMEMTGSWKAWKSKSSFSPLSTPPWESRQRREIPTFPQPRVAPDGKVGNHNQVSHFPTRVARRQLLLSQEQTPNQEIGRFAASLISSQDHVVCTGNATRSQKHLAEAITNAVQQNSVLVAARWPVLK